MNIEPKYYLDPDYRRTPKTKRYCARCQRDIEGGADRMKVSIDWNTMQVWADNDGKYTIGIECWKQIKARGPINS